MIKATVTLESMSPYSPSKPVNTPRKDNETWEQWEERVWRDRMHVDENGQVFIPPSCLKGSLDKAAQYVGKKIAGEGAKRFTQKFYSGVLAPDGMKLGIDQNSVEGEWLYLHANGRDGARVWRLYPKIPNWRGEITFFVLDPTISEAVFREHVIAAGLFIGVGRFRPANRGFYGRYKLIDLKWEVDASF